MRWLVTTLLVLAASLPGVAAEKPNILFCFADDWGRYASCYAPLDAKPTANSVIQTPHIDTVARRGVIFRNAFVPAPSCTPCRSSLLSGRYFFNTGRGAILSGAVWDEKIPSSPLLLRDRGYDIGKIGKVWSPGVPVDAPIGEQRYAYQKSGMGFNNFSQQATQAVQQGKTVAAAKADLIAQVQGNFAAFLKARDPQKPFFFWFGPTNVHRKWVKGSGKALWGIDPDALKGKLPSFLPDVPEVREDFADYLGEAQAFDACVGILLQQLKEAGELEKTVVVISGDHGAPGFPGGKCNLYDFGTAVALVIAGPGIPGPRVVDDFTNLMDLTPTFLEIGGVKFPEGLDGKSLWPVLTSKQQGLVDPQRTWVVTGRERHVGDARAGNKPYPQRALRTKDFLYIRNFAPDRYPMGDPQAVTVDSAPTANELENNTFVAFADMDASPTKAWLVAHRNDPQWQWHYNYAFAKRPAEELYDLRNDPDQVKNVATDKNYETIRQEMANRLIKILTQAGDPRVVEKDCRFEKPPFTDFVRKK
ncbi:MAG: sulfatase [Gemmataceae bacterium]|nr:sulfatase [Gemmata sp.]MDW8197795.1 sulfatase [Gemmataceae bacterium]